MRFDQPSPGNRVGESDHLQDGVGARAAARFIAVGTKAEEDESELAQVGNVLCRAGLSGRTGVCRATPLQELYELVRHASSFDCVMVPHRRQRGGFAVVVVMAN